MIFDFFIIIPDGPRLQWRITDNPIAQRNIGGRRKVDSSLTTEREVVAQFFLAGQRSWRKWWSGNEWGR
jgi:hypothetical protein